MRACNGVGRGYPCPLGEHTTTDVVIVCYNYTPNGNDYICKSEGNAEVRPLTNSYASRQGYPARGSPFLCAYNGTFGHLYIGTFVPLATARRV